MLAWLLTAAVSAGPRTRLIDAQVAQSIDQPTGPPGTTADAQLTFKTTGLMDSIIGAFDDFTWMLVGPSSSYEIYVSGTGDTPTGDSLNTWLSLSVDRSWALHGTIASPKVFDGTYQLRLASTLEVLGSNTFTLDATPMLA